MSDYLDLEAALATAFVHPGGAVATDYLLETLHLAAGDRALDLGCGTGATAASAKATGVRVVGLELRPTMLAAARGRSKEVSLVRADAAKALPFADASFDAVWAESVVALLDPRVVAPELLRVVRPGGRIALNERIWRPGTTTAEATRINALSVRCFGLPAAAVDPIDRDAWTSLLERSGYRVESVTAVDDLQLMPPNLALSDWLLRQRRSLAEPLLFARSLRWRWLIRRHCEAWSRLESWIFVAERPP